MNKIYHHHVRLRHTMWDDANAHKVYDLTLAIRIDRRTKEKKGSIVIGAAVVSRKDCYSKKEGNHKAEQRLLYNPTFIFPLRHRNEFNSMKYWIEEVEGMAIVAPTYLRELILNKQLEFDKTKFGIQVKQAMQKKKAEDAEVKKLELKQIIKEGKASAPARRKARKLARAEKIRLRILSGVFP